MISTILSRFLCALFYRFQISILIQIFVKYLARYSTYRYENHFLLKDQISIFFSPNLLILLFWTSNLLKASTTWFLLTQRAFRNRNPMSINQNRCHVKIPGKFFRNRVYRLCGISEKFDHEPLRPLNYLLQQHLWWYGR